MNYRYIARSAGLPLILAAMLAGCGLVKKEDPSEQATDAAVVPVAAVSGAPAAAPTQAPQKGDKTVLDALGDLAAIDLGPRKGGCTLQDKDGRNILVAGASADSGVVGNGAVRQGGALVMLKTEGVIGLDGLKSGKARLSNGSLTVEVNMDPSQGGTATGNLLVTAAGGKQRLYAPAKWACR